MTPHCGGRLGSLDPYACDWCKNIAVVTCLLVGALIGLLINWTAPT